MRKESLKASDKAKVREIFATHIHSTNPPTPYNVVLWEDGEGKLKVSFYDARYASKAAGWGEHGQFIATYYLESIQQDEKERGKRGLDLHGDIPEWSVDAEAMGNLLFRIDDVLKVETDKEKKRFKMVSLPYGAKVLAVQKAIRGGMAFYLDTYVGSLKVEGIDSDGSWATTGRDFSQRSWAICSTQIDRWFAQTL